MKNFTKTTLALLTASVMATSVFAASDKTPTDRIQSAKGSVEALAVTLENMGANVDTNVDLNSAHSVNQKVSAYQTKHAELQAQFDELRAQSAE